MNQQQFNQIKAAVLYMLRFGEYQQALGMLQGACAMTNLQSTKANGLIRDIEQSKTESVLARMQQVNQREAITV